MLVSNEYKGVNVDNPFFIKHIGVIRRSGRYPWGSGENPYQRSASFVNEYKKLKKEGLKETEIAEYFGMTTTEMRANLTISRQHVKERTQASVRALADTGLGPTAIGNKLDIPESTVRNYLKNDIAAKKVKSHQVYEILKDAVDGGAYVDYGLGVETNLGVSTEQMRTAVQMMKNEGYQTYQIFVKQIGVGTDQSTPIKVVVPPGVTLREVMQGQDRITAPGVIVDSNKEVKGLIKKPVSVDSKRVQVAFAEDGGKDKDGTIELRRGVPDLDLGTSRYAQVRIAVDDTHYLKGVAIYADDLPSGVDIRYNSNKSKNAVDKKGAMKEMDFKGADPNNPFGNTSIKKQFMYKDPITGKAKQSPLNIVNEEGAWDSWTRSISAQVLSKQPEREAKRQLKLTRDKTRSDFDEIMQLENPVVKRKLLQAFADKCDRQSAELKAAAYPRQASQLILPVKSMNPKEIYAPNYKEGETVALIRYPHGGTFEIPILKVNNKNKAAQRLMGKDARDAVGIHPSVADRLSGADFDGDTVVVIPNNDGRIKSSKPLVGLQGFDPKDRYPYRKGMSVMSKGHTQKQMGQITNLITDMSVKGATPEEITRAVKHSMVVIDAAKHKLDYKQSYIDNNIAGLKKKYQTQPSGKVGGPSTIISRSDAEVRVAKTKPRSYKDGGPIDPKTGEKVFVKSDKKGTEKTRRMYTVRDAHKLVGSPATKIETIYADHANAMKSIANQARKASLATSDIPYSSAARRKYQGEVDSLDAKLRNVYRNKPKERKAQLLANSYMKMVRADNKDLDKKSIEKLERAAITRARNNVGIVRNEKRITFTDREWEAVQAGAITKTKMEKLIANADSDHLAKMATPKSKPVMSRSQINRAKQMLNDYTIAEVADTIGVSPSTIRNLVIEG